MNDTLHASNIKDSALKEGRETDTILECLTDKCQDCTGSYINRVLGHKLTCICECHKLKNESANYIAKTEAQLDSLIPGDGT